MSPVRSVSRVGERAPRWAFAVLAALALVDGLLAVRYRVPGPLSALLAVFALLSLIVAWRARLERGASGPARAPAPPLANRSSSSLFTRDTAQDRALALEQLERFDRRAVPWLTVALALVEGFLAWWLLAGAAPAAVSETPGLLRVAGLLLAQAFGLYVLGTYLVALGRPGEHPRPDACAQGVMVGAWASALVAAGAAAHALGAPVPGRLLAAVPAGLLGLLAIEHVLRVVGEWYRPRTAAGPRAATYESRLLGVFARPTAWAAFLAEALDYQFGFKVSETRVYRVLGRGLAPFLLVQAAILYLLSCLVFLGPEEQGVRERLGKPVPDRWLLDSGFHVKWPWPFETVRRLPVKRIQRFTIGIELEDREEPGTILWTESHFKAEDRFIVASPVHEPAAQEDADPGVPVSLLSIYMPVEYMITNLHRYVYGHADPAALVEDLAYRSLLFESTGRDLEGLMASGRLEAAEAIRRRLQEEAARMQLGVRVDYVGLQDVHPPVLVAGAFEDVVGAVEEQHASVLEARAYRNDLLPQAQADATGLVARASAYRVRREALAEAEAARFRERAHLGRLSPNVFARDMYLRSVERALPGTRKYLVVSPPDSEVFEFSFE